MQVLIIGGAGYIGSHINNYLINKNIDTIILDNLYNSNLKLSNKNTKKIYIGDYGNKKLLNQIFKENNIDIIIHLASYISISDSIKHPIKYYYNNVYKTKKLLKEMKRYKINNIIFSSSAAVYGKNNHNISLKENFNLIPSNPYGKNKLRCEQLIKKSGLNYCILRFFNVSGSDFNIGENHKNEFHIIPLLVKAMIKNKIFYLNGQNYNTKDGTCIRDYIHIKDLIDLIYQCCLFIYQNNDVKTIFNAGSGIGTSNLDLINKIIKIDNNFQYKIKSGNYFDSSILIADIYQANKILNWYPKFSNIDLIIKDKKSAKKHGKINTVPAMHSFYNPTCEKHCQGVYYKKEQFCFQGREFDFTPLYSVFDVNRMNDNGRHKNKCTCNRRQQDGTSCPSGVLYCDDPGRLS